MTNRHEFELVTNKTANYKAFINVLKYRTPHIHLDYEIGMILYGELRVTVEDKQYNLVKGDIMCLNPCQIHEFSSGEQVALLLIQVNPSYFNSIFPLIQSIEFDNYFSLGNNYSDLYQDFRKKMFEFAETFIRKESLYELRCAGLLNLLFSDLLQLVPYQETSSEAGLSARSRVDRIRRIAEYIENHYTDRIRLSDIAALENVTETHMSHFFTDNFHMTFQDYLMKLRCEKARTLLLTTELSLFDISYTCGFSDPKYLNSGFIKQYNCTPKQYRQQFGHQKLAVQQTSMLTTQQILSDKTSLVLLKRYR